MRNENEFRSIPRTARSITLQRMLSQLYDRHPTAGRDMHSANDLDAVLRNTVHPNSPPGVSHRVVCHDLKSSIDDGNDGRSEKLTQLKNLSTEVATCFMKRASVIGFRA